MIKENIFLEKKRERMGDGNMILRDGKQKEKEEA